MKYNYKKQTIVFTLFIILAIIFTIIYYRFSHDVHSTYLNLLWVWPALGAIYSLFMLKHPRQSHRSTNNLMCAGTGSAAMAFTLSGIVEIAGTASDYIKYLLVLGLVMIAASLLISVEKHNKIRSMI